MWLKKEDEISKCSILRLSLVSVIDRENVIVKT